MSALLPIPCVMNNQRCRHALAGVEHIISADTDFDRLPSITRLYPMLIGEWGSSLPIRSGC